MNRSTLKEAIKDKFDYIKIRNQGSINKVEKVHNRPEGYLQHIRCIKGYFPFCPSSLKSSHKSIRKKTEEGIFPLFQKNISIK